MYTIFHFIMVIDVVGLGLYNLSKASAMPKAFAKASDLNDTDSKISNLFSIVAVCPASISSVSASTSATEILCSTTEIKKVVHFSIPF